MNYYSHLLGFTKKISVPWKAITNLEKTEKGILVKSTTEKEDLLFEKFSELNRSYKFIRRIWSRESPHAPDDSESELEESGMEEGDNDWVELEKAK